MKTQFHLQKLYSKEILAWFVLTCSLLLLGISVSLAQEPDKTNLEGKIHIKIEKEENGNKVKVDTTFDVKDYARMQEYLHQLDEDLEMPELSQKASGQNKKMRFHSFSFDEKDKEKFSHDMKKLEKDMKDLEKEFKEMRFEMFTDSFPNMPHFRMRMDGWDDESFNFNWDGKEGLIGKKGNCIKIISDSLDGDDRVIIIGEGSGESHTVEKKTGESGEQIIIIKKSKKSEKGEGARAESKIQKTKKPSSKLETLHLKYYPNPGNGRFTLSFELEKKGDTHVTIHDPSGKEVYNENINDFSGEYTRQIDISKNGKGTYMLTITQNGKSVSKKIVVE